ncbi:DEAD/DEAH box helicase family protein [Cryptosporidium felis]|nr:DEAD/DEAH box helicase family protein [Cryptosporidium felis]
MNEYSDDIKLGINSSVRFTDFPLHHILIDILSSYGFIFPSPVQYHLLSQEILENNIIIQAKSGTGKTIAFVLFILNNILNGFDNGQIKIDQEFELLSILISPTREICIQISETFSIFIRSINKFYSVDNIYCIGGGPIIDDIYKLEKSSKTILTSTPGRFIQLINYNSGNFISMKNMGKSLQFLLFDEADRLLEDCFIEYSIFILQICMNLPNTRFIAFSATFPPQNLQILRNTLFEIRPNRNDDNSNSIRQIHLCSSLGATRNNEDKIVNIKDITYTSALNEGSMLSFSNGLESPVLKALKFYMCDNLIKEFAGIDTRDSNYDFICPSLIDSIIDILLRVSFRQSLIFLNNSSIGYKVTSALKSFNVPVMYINGRRLQSEREEILVALRENKCRVVICSDLLSRGIDIKMIDLVINVDVPIDKETFLHRAGRSGRFGQSGVVICIPYCIQDYDSFKYFFDQLGINYGNFYDNFDKPENNIECIYTYNRKQNMASNNELSKFEKGVNLLNIPIIEPCDDSILQLNSCSFNCSNTKNEKQAYSSEMIDFCNISMIDDFLLEIWKDSAGKCD